MTNAPQSVTEHYIGNLIRNGRNKEFDIDHIQMKESIIDGTLVGYYFYVRILSKQDAHNAHGATIAQAVRNCLIKYGVTFR